MDSPKTVKNLTVFEVMLITLLFCAVAFFTGRYTVKDDKLLMKYYCENVTNGAWPDYKDLGKKGCRKYVKKKKVKKVQKSR